MSYSIEEALEIVRPKIADSSVELRVSFTRGRACRADFYRTVVWSKGQQECGAVSVSAALKATAVEFGVQFAASSHPHDRSYGCDDPAEAARRVLEFILSPQEGRLLRVHVEFGRAPVVHELKCWPEFFRPLQRGEKNFEYRQTRDRIFVAGDVLDLREWEPAGERTTDGRFTGPRELRVVTYVLTGKAAEAVGVPAWCAVLALRPL